MPRFAHPLFCTLIFVVATAAHAAEPTIYHAQSRWIGEKHWVAADQQITTGPAEGDAARWALEPSEAGTYLIRNVGADTYATLTDDAGRVELVADKPTTDRGRWVVTPVGPHVSIRNKATSTYLNIEKPDAPVDGGLDKRPDAKHWWSGLWNLVHVAGPEPEPFPMPGVVKVTKPAYGEHIQGDTRFAVHAPGMTKVTVKSWLPGGAFGENTTVGDYDLDSAGRGDFTFPADRFPHGPMMVHIQGTDGSSTNNNYFMVYNTGGIRWNAGAPDGPPPAARGMRLVYEDDFDSPELSISKDGRGTTYTSHKVGGGDFSGVPFGDHESKDTTPFSQIDTYLRIRADQQKNTTGLIASIGEDGKGITAKAPAYFECRFIAQSAPGTWPAFWVMTNYMLKADESTRPLQVPADELDIIEAYGGEGPGTPNAPGYMIASHYWNQGEDGKKDYTQDRHYGPIHMTQIDGGGGASWYQTFHTYGVLVGAEDTIYYCDNIEVARHKTARLSGTEPIFFYINLAIGGASGWKIDLSQYDGQADMYVDYVRVYQAK